MIDRALEIAVSAHTGQMDKLGAPYILHPLRVGMSLQHVSEDAVITGFLHDVIEDSAWTLEMLRAKGFNENILTALHLLTHLPNEPYEEYIKRVRWSVLATTVKLADIADNTAPSRTKNLDAETHKRLALKYGKALKILNQ